MAAAIIFLIIGIIAGLCNSLPYIHSALINFPFLEPICSFSPKTLTSILGALLTYLGIIFQRQYQKRQAWEQIQKRLEEKGLSLQLIGEWRQLGLAGDRRYLLLHPGDWLPWLSRELLNYPFEHFVHEKGYHPNFRTFLELAICFDDREVAPLWHSLQKMEKTENPSLWKVAFRESIQWWKDSGYRPDAWPIFIWMLWWKWEQMPKVREKESSFCREIRMIFGELNDEARFLSSLLADEVLQRAGVHCPKITAAAYRPDRTLWYALRHQNRARRPSLEIDTFLELAEEPTGWPWGDDAPKDLDAHVVIVAEHELERLWAVRRLYDYWWENRAALPVFPVVISALDADHLWRSLADTWIYWIAPHRNPWAFWALAGHNQQRLFALFQHAYASKAAWRQRLWELWFFGEEAPSSDQRSRLYEQALLMRWGTAEPVPANPAHQVETFLVVPPALRPGEPWRVWFVYYPEHAMHTAQNQPSLCRELWNSLAHRRAFLRAVLPPAQGKRVAQEVGAFVVQLQWTRESLERTWARWLRAQRGLPPDGEWPWESLLPPEARIRVKEALNQARSSLGRFLDNVDEVMKGIEPERKQR